MFVDRAMIGSMVGRVTRAVSSDTGPASVRIASGEGQPIVFQGGFSTDFGSYSALHREFRKLDRPGYQVNTPHRTLGSFEDEAGLFDAVVRRAAETSPTGRVTIVAHSKGGSISRHALQFLGTDAYADRLITLGSVHGGFSFVNDGLSTAVVGASRLPALRDLRRGSEAMRRLERDLPRFLEEADPGFESISAIAGTGIKGSDGLVTSTATRIPNAESLGGRVGVYELEFRDRSADHLAIGGMWGRTHRPTMEAMARLVRGEDPAIVMGDARNGVRSLVPVTTAGR